MCAPRAPGQDSSWAVEDLLSSRGWQLLEQGLFRFITGAKHAVSGQQWPWDKMQPNLTPKHPVLASAHFPHGGFPGAGW